MQVFLNDLSLAGQFPSVAAFQTAIRTMMTMRGKMRQFGRELYCHRNVAQAQMTHNLTMRQAIQQFNQDERRAVMGWLTQHGPFWEDDRRHEADDYLEHEGKIVTDTALGEAASRCFNGNTHQLVSLIPSSWMFTPIPVVWQRDDCVRIEVTNHWEIDSLEIALRAASPAIQSWQHLAETMQNRCTNLTFAAESFEPLRSEPFVDGAAKRVVELLKTLDKLKACFDEYGQRTPEGHRIYQDHCTGSKAWFSDSSDTEQNEFGTQLSFKHPEREGETLFCPWHGKIKTPQFRIHFSWPIRADEPLYIMYIGPKITKR
jgi:hypothetical protein